MLKIKNNVNKSEIATAITPSAKTQLIQPPKGKTFKSVMVRGDSNLIPSNIKSGISIFGISGNYIAESGDAIHYVLGRQDANNQEVSFITDYDSSWYVGYAYGIAINPIYGTSVFAMVQDNDVGISHGLSTENFADGIFYSTRMFDDEIIWLVFFTPYSTLLGHL